VEKLKLAEVFSVTETTIGSLLDTDLAIGASVLSLASAAMFDPDGGQLILGGTEIHSYISIDVDAGTVTLADTLLAAWGSSTEVQIYPIVTQRFAEVLPVGSKDHDSAVSVRARIPNLLMDRIPTGVRSPSEWATLAYDGREWVLQDVPGTIPVIAGSLETSGNEAVLLADGFSRVRRRRSATKSINNGTSTLIDYDTVQDVDNDGYVLSDTVIELPRTGQYIVLANARFAANGTGLRQLVGQKSTDGGGVWADQETLKSNEYPKAEAVGVAIVAASIGADAGHQFRFRVLQTSGGALNLNDSDLLFLYLGPDVA
jgi:hypothetical protein